MIELQDVFQCFGAEYEHQHALSHSQHKAMSAICQCRSSELGGHLDVCESCGVLRISYNSCRNRNCPKCGNLKKEQWVMDRKSELLPVPYFHTVFTVPDLLNPLFRSNENQMYTILFAAASQTLTVLSLDKKYLGAQIGVTMVLHTWGQNLAFHPHVHCIIPGGGLTPSGLSFVKSRKKFFIPVKVMSKVFKGKFMAMLKEAIKYGKIRFPISASSESASEKENGFSELMNSLYLKSWVVFCKKPFRNPGTVVEYLSRYTHKTAIGNHRLVEMDNESVSFRWKDYRNGNKAQIMRLDAQEFIRRFMMHVLPSGFQRIRYYGLLSNRNRSTKLKTCFKIIKIPIPLRIKLSTKDLLLKVLGVDVTVCKHCGGHWATLRSWMPGTS